MHRSSLLLLALSIFCLNACKSNSPAKTDKSISYELSDWNWFSIQSDQEFQEHIVRDDESVAWTTYETITTKRSTKDFSVYLYPSLPSSCSPSLTGASEVTPLPATEGATTWGKVDFWDMDNVFYYRGIADLPSISPLCHPPFPADDNDRLSPRCGGKVPRDEAEGDGMCGQWRRDYEVEHGLYSSYALCSQKNGKTVVICVNQVTDNPELAKSIFETFRWTE